MLSRIRLAADKVNWKRKESTRFRNSLAYTIVVMGVATLVLCPYSNSWPHMSARVAGLQPFTLVSTHSRHTRHWSHHGTNGVDCTAPHGPTNRQ